VADFVNTTTVELFEISSLNFYGSKMWSEAWTSSTLWCMHGYITFLIF